MLTNERKGWGINITDALPAWLLLRVIVPSVLKVVVGYE